MRQVGWEPGITYKISDLQPYPSQRFHAGKINLLNQVFNLLFEGIVSNKQVIGVNSNYKTTGNTYAHPGQILQHFAEGGIFSSHQVNIINTYLVKQKCIWLVHISS